MRKFYIMFLVFTVLSLSAGDLFLVGGHGVPEVTYKKMIKAANIDGTAHIGIITASSADPVDSGEFYIEEFERFTNDTISVVAYWFNLTIDNYSEMNQADSLIAKAADMGAFFFGGGDQNRYLKALINSDGSDSHLLAAIRTRVTEFAAIGGTSAGTAVQSQQTMIANGDNYTALLNGARLFEDDGTNDLMYQEGGLGFFQYGVMDTHFTERGRQGRLSRLLLDRMPATGQNLGFGVDENTCMWVKNPGSSEAEIEVIRDKYVTEETGSEPGVWIINTENAQLVNEEITGIKMHFLSLNDKYYPESGEVVFADYKTAVTEPKYTYAAQTSDIFNYQYSTLPVAAEIKRLTSFLVDSNQELVSGYSFQQDPVVKMEITKGSNFSGVTFTDNNDNYYAARDLDVHFKLNASVNSYSSDFSLNLGNEDDLAGWRILDYANDGSWQLADGLLKLSATESAKDYLISPNINFSEYAGKFSFKAKTDKICELKVARSAGGQDPYLAIEDLATFGLTTEYQAYELDLSAGVDNYLLISLVCNEAVQVELDDLSLTTAGISGDLVLSEDFEAEIFPPADWTLTTSAELDGEQIPADSENDNTWYQSTTAHDGNYSAGISYSVLDYHWLITPEMNLTTAAISKMFFWISYVGGDDYGYPEFRVMVKDQTGWHEELLINEDTSYENNWEESLELDLSSYAGKSVQVAFLVRGNDSYSVYLDDITVYTNLTTGVKENPDSVVKVSSLVYNYPNPFNPETTIKFNLSSPTDKMNFIVYNHLGQVVRKAQLCNLKSGLNSLSFNANTLSTGIYFYKLEGKRESFRGKMTLMK